MMRWGLIPYFTKDIHDFGGYSTINGRAESILNATMWKVPLECRRCLIPADGFYEWKKIDAKTKQPYAFSMSDDAPFAFAGLWDAWRPNT
jgi:putative SOS response-associated peptidase YedK